MTMLKTSLAIAATLSLAAAPFAAQAQEADPTVAAETEADTRVFTPVNFDVTEDRENILLLDLSNGERVSIRLKPDWAPNHVERVKTLTRQGFYDGIIFHRVIDGFMAQTGDPTGTGMGGSGTNLDAEFTDYEYREGTVGMARSSNPNSGDSQFFICFDGCGHLTGQYTVWGQVERGMDTVEKLAAGEPPAEPDQIVSAAVID